MVSVDLSLVNGWDDVYDNNSGKTFMGGLGFTPIDWCGFYLSGTYGPEQTDNGHSKRGVFTWVHTLKPTDALTIVGEALYGNETDLVGPNMKDSALWCGCSGYLVYKFNDWFQGAFRTEIFDDADGVRFASPRAPNGSTAWEITPTLAFQVTKGLLARAEYRHDKSNADVFQRSNGNFKKEQDTIEAELIYVF